MVDRSTRPPNPDRTVTRADADTQRSRPAVTALDELEAFHADIRNAVASLHVLVKEAVQWNPNPKEAANLLDVMSGPLLWHDEDEEVSLLPRLRRAPLHEDERRFLELCHRGHDRLETLLDDILPALEDMAHGEQVDLEKLSRDATSLGNLLEPHLTLEEQHLFPVARKRLSAHDVDEIRAEIDARHTRRTGRAKRAVAL